MEEIRHGRPDEYGLVLSPPKQCDRRRMELWVGSAVSREHLKEAIMEGLRPAEKITQLQDLMSDAQDLMSVRRGLSDGIH